MNETYKNPGVLEDGKSYRVWSLTGQGFLKLTTKNGGQSVEYSVTTEEESSNTEILIIVLRWVFQFSPVGVAIRSFCWLLIRYLKPFLFVFCVPFQISNLTAACSVLYLSERSRERSCITYIVYSV